MKSFTAILIGCLAVFNTSPAEAQQPTMTQIVPENTAHVVIFRNVTEWKERGDEFLKEMGYPFGVSNLLGFLGIQLQETADDDARADCD